MEFPQRLDTEDAMLFIDELRLAGLVVNLWSHSHPLSFKSPDLITHFYIEDGVGELAMYSYEETPEGELYYLCYATEDGFYVRPYGVS